MSRPALLIVDDEFNTRETLVEFLGRKFDVSGAGNGAEAIKLLQTKDFDLILTDLRMPEADGMSVLDAAAGKAKRPKCIMMTAYGSIDGAVAAMKHGAFDFITKPIKLAKLEEVIAAALAAGKTPENENTPGSPVMNKTDNERMIRPGSMGQALRR